MKYWCLKLNILYIKYIKLLKYFREHSNMIYDRLNETFVAHDDSSIFIAVIMSCSKSTVKSIRLGQQIFQKG